MIVSFTYIALYFIEIRFSVSVNCIVVYTARLYHLAYLIKTFPNPLCRMRVGIKCNDFTARFCQKIGFYALSLTTSQGTQNAHLR